MFRASKTSLVRRCLKCREERRRERRMNNPKDEICPDCGHAKDSRSKFCQPCWNKRIRIAVKPHVEPEEEPEEVHEDTIDHFEDDVFERRIRQLQSQEDDGEPMPRLDAAW